MKARDVMVTPVITVDPDCSVKDLARLLVERRISAVPVVDGQGQVVGIVGEGNLMHRSETDTERRHPWWLRTFMAPSTLAAEYAKAHGRKVSDIMARDVITADPDTSLSEIAILLERNGIKRVPIIRNSRLVGIVTRANLVQAVAGAGAALDIQPTDAAIRDRLLAHLKAQPWAHTSLLNVIVRDGVVDLWGMTTSKAEKEAVRIAAETMNGVRTVNDHMVADFVPKEILEASDASGID